MGCVTSKQKNSCLFIHWSGLKTWFPYSNKEVKQKITFIPDIKEFNIVKIPPMRWTSNDGTSHNIWIYMLTSNKKQNRCYNELANNYYKELGKRMKIDIKSSLMGSIIFECSFSNPKYEKEFMKLQTLSDL